MTSPTSGDDLFAHGIQKWAQQLRDGKLSFAETVQHCTQRTADNEKLNAFECIDAERALANAKGFDQLLQNGTDLGPLMGLPVGIKDIMAVAGFPTTNGSNADTAHITGSEGQVVQTLKAAGCIIFGKTRTVEFALGATGVNESRGTPWNPCDREIHRIPGGSSSGSAVSVAAGMVGLATGSDTGGSIRIPACFTGLIGHKTTVGQWPTDGVFPLSPTLDSIGGLCRTIQDASLLHTLFTGQSITPKTSVAGLRFGVPQTLFLDDLDETVAKDFDRALSALEKAGAIRVDMDFPEALEREYLFPDIVGPEIISSLSLAVFEEIRGGMDPVTEYRASLGLDVQAHRHLGAQKRRKHLIAKALLTFNELDCWISPTCPFVPLPMADLQTEAGHKRSMQASRNTQPGNLLNMCAVSLPMHDGALPTGLQMMMPAEQDKRLLESAFAVEGVIAG